MPNFTPWVPAAILGIGCILIADQREQKVTPLAAPLTELPREMFGLKSTDLVIEEKERAIAGMSDYVLRIFKRDSLDAFSVYVGYYDYQRQGKSIHSPKNCLPGGGWEPMSSGVQAVQAGNGQAVNVNRYLLGKGPSRALVYYWYQGRGRIESNEYRVKWDLLRDAALSGRTEEALVRLVLPIAPDFSNTQVRPTNVPRGLLTVAQADSLAQRIATEIIPAVNRALPKGPGE